MPAALIPPSARHLPKHVLHQHRTRQATGADDPASFFLGRVCGRKDLGWGFPRCRSPKFSRGGARPGPHGRQRGRWAERKIATVEAN